VITLAVIAAVTGLILVFAALLGAYLERQAERQSTPVEEEQ
jgi:uncharacterized iron-regulated membrane protein